MNSLGMKRLRACAAARSNSAPPTPGHGAPAGPRARARQIVAEGHMSHADEREVIVVNGENRVAIEIDPVDVGGDAVGRKRRAKSQSPVLRGQREKMRQECGARAVVETLDGDSH